MVSAAREAAGGGVGARWPKTGWLDGNVSDLARFCELLLVDDEGLGKAADRFQTTVEALTAKLRSDPQDAVACKDVAAEMKQDDNEQTTMMALAMMANAFVFERSIEGTPHRETGDPLPVSKADDTQAIVLKNWETIISHNYWPIFKIASEVLGCLRVITAKRVVIPQLVALADDLAGFGATATGDIAGQLFGTLISDRKFLATFYTLPPSAFLMAELVAAQLERSDAMPVDQGSQAWQQFRIADLACGTGALLTALYQRIAARIRSAGKDDADLHQTFLEHVIYAVDIMPAAAHLTATLLASVHPSTTFTRSHIVLSPYGRQDDGSVRIGSLELLDEEHDQQNLLGAPAEGTAVGGQAEHGRTERIRHGLFDAVVMNPPFTSDTGGQKSDDNPTPTFAGLSNDQATQTEMKERSKRQARQRARKLVMSIPGLKPARRAKVGLASDFIDLADLKLRPRGGLLGLILPQAFLSAYEWSSARTFIERLYDDIVVLTIATTGSEDRAFSDDTGMAECMVVARRAGPTRISCSVTNVMLARRPVCLIEGVEMARLVADLPATSTFGSLRLGDELCGSWARSNRISGRHAGVSDLRVADAASSLATSVLNLYRTDAQPLPITTLGMIGRCGPRDHAIGNKHGNKDQSGPLEVFDPPGGREAWQTFAYPTLWGHDHKQEALMEVLPNGDGQPKIPARKVEADRLWDRTASRLHFNRHFQLNSQPLAACLTPADSIGGAGWPSFRLTDANWMYATVLWHNTTLGLLLWWLIAARQQQGRSIITVGLLPDLPTLDCRELNDSQHRHAEAIWREFRKRTLLPANEAYRDETRIALDEAVLSELLGLSWSSTKKPLATLRRQWCSEPTVHGNKPTRPGGKQPTS